MSEITVTEDQALSMEIELGQLVLDKFKEGYRIKHKYQHPAVGLVVVMEDDADLSSIK